LAIVRRRARATETVYSLYVTDSSRHLSGILSLRDLVVADPEATLLTVCTHGYGKRTPFGPGTELTGPGPDGDGEGEAVDVVARGRVWSGEDARARGLVDQLGGLMDAIARAKQKSGAPEELAITIYQSSPGLLGSLVGAAAPESLLQSALPTTPALPPGLQSLAEQLGSAAWLLEKSGVQARLEYSVEIR
jgi:hypothetical protein